MKSTRRPRYPIEDPYQPSKPVNHDVFFQTSHRLGLKEIFDKALKETDGKTIIKFLKERLLVYKMHSAYEFPTSKNKTDLSDEALLITTYVLDNWDELKYVAGHYCDRKKAYNLKIRRKSNVVRKSA